MSQLEDLSAQLSSNLEQLAQLDELLAADPANAEIKSIRDDLLEVINVTLQLQKADQEQKQNAGASTAAAAAAQPAAPAAAASSALPASHSTAASGYAPISAFAAAAAASSVPPASAPATSFLPSASGIYPPGARVMALYSKDGKYYVARVDAVDEGTESYRITFLEYNQPASVEWSNVKPWVCATPEQLRLSNTPVKALYPEDGLFYAGSLDGPGSTPGYYAVKFGAAATGSSGKKKKRVEVAREDICINERFLDPTSMQFTSHASAAAKAGAAPLTEEFVVPAHLESVPGEPEAVRLSKAKKLKKLRFEHKKAYEEQQSNLRKNSWLDFKAGKTATGAGGAAKKAKLTHAPGLAQLQKPSIFATPDSVDGVVGVVGSGRGMTETNMVRKKHEFEKA